MADELRARLAGIDHESAKILDRAREQAADELEEVRRELRAMRRRLAFAPATQATEVTQAETDLDALAERLTPAEEDVPSAERVLPPGAGESAIEIGDTVWVPVLNATGQVLSLEGRSAEVQIGAFRVRTRRATLQLRQKATPTTTEPEAGDEEPRITSSPAPAVSVELHLRGMRVNEALSTLERYVDDAYRSQAPFVRIVHGKGTGALRKAVHAFLQDHPLVSSFRMGELGEGGAGVTIVKFDAS